jgi:hypothetical protein
MFEIYSHCPIFNFCSCLLVLLASLVISYVAFFCLSLFVRFVESQRVFMGSVALVQFLEIQCVLYPMV